MHGSTTTTTSCIMYENNFALFHSWSCTALELTMDVESDKCQKRHFGGRAVRPSLYKRSRASKFISPTRLHHVRTHSLNWIGINTTLLVAYHWSIFHDMLHGGSRQHALAPLVDTRPVLDIYPQELKHPRHCKRKVGKICDGRTIRASDIVLSRDCKALFQDIPLSNAI